MIIGAQSTAGVQFVASQSHSPSRVQVQSVAGLDTYLRCDSFRLELPISPSYLRCDIFTAGSLVHLWWFYVETHCHLDFPAPFGVRLNAWLSCTSRAPRSIDDTGIIILSKLVLHNHLRLQVRYPHLSLVTGASDFCLFDRSRFCR
jgi:hypothetical protein